MTDRHSRLRRLEEAGFTLSALSDEQHRVLADLSDGELDILLDIKHRLDAVGPEVQAHSDMAGGALF